MAKQKKQKKAPGRALSRTTPESLVPADKARLAALNRMTPDGRELAKEIEQQCAKSGAVAVLSYYDAGAKVAAAVADEATYGNGYVEDLAEYMDWSGGANALYDLMDFSKTFAREFVKTNSLTVMRNGSTLNLSHWQCLTQLKTEEERLKYLTATLKNGWSARVLADEIKTPGASKKNLRQGGGRSPSVPSSPSQGLRRLFKSAQAMVRFSPVAGEYVFDKFDELEAADVSTALAEQLTVTREMVVRLRDSAMDAEERLTRNLDHVQKLLEGAADAVTAPAVAAAEDLDLPPTGEDEAAAPPKRPTKPRPAAKKAKKKKGKAA